MTLLAQVNSPAPSPSTHATLESRISDKYDERKEHPSFHFGSSLITAELVAAFLHSRANVGNESLPSVQLAIVNCRELPPIFLYLCCDTICQYSHSEISLKTLSRHTNGLGQVLDLGINVSDSGFDCACCSPELGFTRLFKPPKYFTPALNVDIEQVYLLLHLTGSRE